MCPTHVKFKAGQGRICYVMCWGLQHFIGLLHNRKPGTHCLPGLKQQACPVLPPPLPCDTKEDMWPIEDKKAGGWGVFEGRNACASGPHPSPLQASSAEVVLGLPFPFISRMQAIFYIRAARQNVKCSANLYPQPVMRYQLRVSGTVQRATCNPCKRKSTACHSHRSHSRHRYVPLSNYIYSTELHAKLNLN